MKKFFFHIKNKHLPWLLVIVTLIVLGSLSLIKNSEAMPPLPYIASALDEASLPLSVISEDFTTEHWIPEFDHAYTSIVVQICNVANNGWPMFHDGEQVTLNKPAGTGCIDLSLNGGQFDGIKFLPTDIISESPDPVPVYYQPSFGTDGGLSAELELEYMPTSYHSSSYDQKWESNPTFENNTLHLFKGSGNVITQRIQVAEKSDASAPLIAGQGSGLFGVFSLEMYKGVVNCPANTTVYDQFDYTETATPICGGTGRLNYLKISERGVGYDDFNIQYAPATDIGVAFIDAYDEAESIQFTTETNVKAPKWNEGNYNSNVIGIFSGMKPILTPADETSPAKEYITYTHEVEYEYMPTSYDVSSYDQFWSIDPVFEDNKQYISSGSGNVITDRSELTAQLNDLNPIVGYGGGTGVFSIENSVLSSTSQCIDTSWVGFPLPGLQAPSATCDVSQPFGYVKDSLRGVGFMDTFFQFAPSSNNNIGYIDSYNRGEFIQSTTESKARVWNDTFLGSNTSVQFQTINSNVIGDWTGSKPVRYLTTPSDSSVATHDFDNTLEIEYTPVSVSSVDYDRKWSIIPHYADGGKLCLLAGSGNLYTSNYAISKLNDSVSNFVSFGGLFGLTDTNTIDPDNFSIAFPGTGYADFYVQTDDTGILGLANCTPVITAIAGPNGSISSPGATMVNFDGSQSYTITPNADYHVADVLMDGVSVGAANDYTFSNVAADHTISAIFAYTQGGGGTPLINGTCDPATNGKTFSVAPTSLCTAGIPTPATLKGDGPWTWDCLGSGGGFDNYNNDGNSCSAGVNMTTPIPPTQPSIPEKQLVCPKPFNVYMRYNDPVVVGGMNDPSQVTFLQNWLNQKYRADLLVTGIYDLATEQAVKKLQSQYGYYVLSKPWTEEAPTGYFYISTQAIANALYCNLPLPILDDLNKPEPKDRSEPTLITEPAATPNETFLSEITPDEVKVDEFPTLTVPVTSPVTVDEIPGVSPLPISTEVTSPTSQKQPTLSKAVIKIKDQLTEVTQNFIFKIRQIYLLLANYFQK